MPASIVCPTCHKAFDPGGSSSIPFCSPRCRQVDLGRWLKESYAVPVPRSEEDESGEESNEGE